MVQNVKYNCEVDAQITYPFCSIYTELYRLKIDMPSHTIYTKFFGNLLVKIFTRILAMCIFIQSFQENEYIEMMSIAF